MRSRRNQNALRQQRIRSDFQPLVAVQAAARADIDPLADVDVAVRGFGIEIDFVFQPGPLPQNDARFAAGDQGASVRNQSIVLKFDPLRVDDADVDADGDVFPHPAQDGLVVGPAHCRRFRRIHGHDHGPVEGFAPRRIQLIDEFGKHISRTTPH
ncbi:hypothetical protein SDC9_158856 [bioreactor metagenome]|uniref:Uncharacterized protein n=1 Tax=bioreactor metagenome TaxID=1076179 RepID=A0A645FGZ1_9ZZZZ